MTRKIVTIEDIEFVVTGQEGKLDFYGTPEFQPYNKHFKASVAYLPINETCYKILKWSFSQESDLKDERFPQYDVFEMTAEFLTQANPNALDSSYSIDLSESDFKEWLLREQLPVI
jgi:hypothetical protein